MNNFKKGHMWSLVVVVFLSPKISFLQEGGMNFVCLPRKAWRKHRKYGRYVDIGSTEQTFRVFPWNLVSEDGGCYRTGFRIILPVNQKCIHLQDFNFGFIWMKYKHNRKKMSIRNVLIKMRCRVNIKKQEKRKQQNLKKNTNPSVTASELGEK